MGKPDPLIMLARHLRAEHGWGIRRIGRFLHMTDTEVERAVGGATDGK